MQNNDKIVGISTEVWVDELSYALLILEDIDYV
jgi:hypothetical protein